MTEDVTRSEKTVASNIVLVIIVVAVLTMIVYFLPRLIWYFTLADWSPKSDLEYEFVSNTFFLCLFAVPLVLCLLYMRLTNRSSLKCFVQGGPSCMAKGFVIGSIVGCVLNCIVIGGALVSGSIQIAFSGMSVMVIVALLSTVIQASCEEVIFRGFCFHYLESRYNFAIALIVSGVLFIAYHWGNILAFGPDPFFMLSIFLDASIMVLLMKLTGSIWSAFGEHTAWNFTQQYFFGLPNSGNSGALYAVFIGSDPSPSFFWNTTYGAEGSFSCVVLLTIVFVVLLVVWRKRSKHSAKEISASQLQESTA